MRSKDELVCLYIIYYKNAISYISRIYDFSPKQEINSWSGYGAEYFCMSESRLMFA